MERIIENGTRVDNTKVNKLKKIRSLLFKYFDNIGFIILLLYLFIYYFLQVLNLLEDFSRLNLLISTIPIIGLISLLCFYIEMKFQSSTNESLSVIAVTLNISAILLIISTTIICYSYLIFIFKSFLIFMIVLFLVLFLIINIQALYYTSRCVTVIRKFIKNGVLGDYYCFSKGSTKWISIGIINIIAGFISLVNDHFSINYVQINESGFQLINTRSNFKLIDVIIAIITLMYPFVLSITLFNSKKGLAKIYGMINIDN